MGRTPLGDVLHEDGFHRGGQGPHSFVSLIVLLYENGTWNFDI
jgi:hypothetical protein